MKTKSIFVCQNCGSQRPKWEGQCRDCGAWNSLVEETVTKAPKGSRSWSVGSSPETAKAALQLDSVIEINNSERWKTGIKELDRVLGGGLVRGSYILLGGDPGIGKSTLLMQMAGQLAREDHRVLYVSGEESVEQTALRAQRLGVRTAQVKVASESRLSNILDLAANEKPDVLIVDSIQTIYLDDIPSAPGTVSQVRECAGRLMATAKGQNIAIFLVGHITKDGSIAGPKTLEHMVDTVLSFEGDANYQYRLLRAQKNRFGPTNELGVFQMSEQGLDEVSNPSEMFLAERGKSLIGSTVFAAIEGSRPLLCEVQALTSSTYMATPRRTAIGIDVNRVHLLAAVLDKHLDRDFARNDVFVNVVGGLRLTEPAADLALAAAMLSTLSSESIAANTAMFGEIGLTGEVRAVTFATERLRETEKLGFQSVVLPRNCERAVRNYSTKMHLQFIRHIDELWKIKSTSTRD